MFAPHYTNLTTKFQLHVQDYGVQQKTKEIKLIPFTHVNLWTSFPDYDAIATFDLKDKEVSFRNSDRIAALLQMKKVKNFWKAGEKLESLKTAHRVMQNVQNDYLFYASLSKDTLDGQQNIFLLCFVDKNSSENIFSVFAQDIFTHSYKL
jgi:hypothetical protein